MFRNTRDEASSLLLCDCVLHLHLRGVFFLLYVFVFCTYIWESQHTLCARHVRVGQYALLIVVLCMCLIGVGTMVGTWKLCVKNAVENHLGCLANWGLCRCAGFPGARRFAMAGHQSPGEQCFPVVPPRGFAHLCLFSARRRHGNPSSAGVRREAGGRKSHKKPGWL